MAWYGMMYVFDFAYKLQLHYNIYKLVFTIWNVKIMKMKLPLGSCELYTKIVISMRISKMRSSKSKMCKIYFRKKGPPDYYYIIYIGQSEMQEIKKYCKIPIYAIDIYWL